MSRTILPCWNKRKTKT